MGLSPQGVQSRAAVPGQVEDGPRTGGLRRAGSCPARSGLNQVSSGRGSRGPGGPRPSPRSSWSPFCPASGRFARSPPPCPSSPLGQRPRPSCRQPQQTPAATAATAAAAETLSPNPHPRLRAVSWDAVPAPADHNAQTSPRRARPPGKGSFKSATARDLGHNRAGGHAGRERFR